MSLSQPYRAITVYLYAAMHSIMNLFILFCAASPCWAYSVVIAALLVTASDTILSILLALVLYSQRKYLVEVLYFLYL